MLMLPSQGARNNGEPGRWLDMFIKSAV